MAYTVARRTREIGCAMALGAVEGDVVWLVMREVLVLVGTGMVLGLGAALALSRYVASLLFDVGKADPITIVIALATLGVVALLADTSLPGARRRSIRCSRSGTNRQARCLSCPSRRRALVLPQRQIEPALSRRSPFGAAFGMIRETP